MDGKWCISTCNVNISCPVWSLPQIEYVNNRGFPCGFPFKMLQLPSLTYTKVSRETFYERFCILHDHSLMYTLVFMHMPECAYSLWHIVISIVCAYCTHVGRHTERMYSQIFLNMRTSLYTQLTMHLEFFALIKLVQCSVATLWTFHFLVKKKQRRWNNKLLETASAKLTSACLWGLKSA